MTNIYHLDLSLSLVYIPFLYFSYTLSFYSFTPLSLFPFHPPIVVPPFPLSMDGRTASSLFKFIYSIESREAREGKGNYPAR